ncbi:MAG: EAL domain-containing protein [Gammaproteobacteria bacterium]
MGPIRIISLRTWLPIVVPGIFLLLALFFLFSTHEGYKKDLYNRSAMEIKQDLAELSYDMMLHLINDELIEADRKLTRKGSRANYRLLLAADTNGVVYSSTDKSLLQKMASAEIDAFNPEIFQQSQQQHETNVIIHEGTDHIIAYQPIRFVRTPYQVDEKKFGGLFLIYDLRVAIETVWQNTLQTLQISLLACLLLTVFFYIFLNRFISRPLAHLTSITRRITGGELGVASNVQGRGEFVELNESINTMSAQLKKNIQKLEKSEKQVKEILWASNVGTWVYDVDSGHFRVNKRWSEFLGYDDDELNIDTIDDWQALLHPYEKESILQSLQNTIDGNSRNLIMEMRLRTKNGDWCWVMTRGRIVQRDKQDRARRISGTIADISKRKRAEADMRMRDRSIEMFNEGVIISNATKPDMPVVYCNQQVENITGYSKEEILGRNCRFLQGNDHEQEGLTKIRNAIAKQEGCTVRIRNYRKDGSLFWNELKIAPVTNEQGELTNYIGSMNDITESKLAEERLNILRRAMESTDSPMIILDRNLMIEYVNPAFLEAMGYSMEQLLGRSHHFLRSESVSEQTYKGVWNRVIKDGIWKGTFENKRSDGTLFQDKCVISAVEDSDKNVTHFVCIHEDITREYELNQQLSYEATHDRLTKLINRGEFERRALRLVESVVGNDDEHAMCFMDMDQFKIINDNCGHSAGDELLRQVGSLLKTVTRKRDTVARLGGDEFAVLMEHCTIEQAHRVANDILNAIQDFTFIWEDRSFKLGISIGLVKIDQNITRLEQLMKQADTACYMAKDLGRNRIHIYYTHDTEIAMREGEMQWVERLYRALEQDQFCFYAQPIMKTSTGVIDHYEILIRMLDRDNNTTPPGAFLPAAERFNIIPKIDQWVIDHAIDLLTGHPNFLDKINSISINLSGQSLGDTNFIKHLYDKLTSNKKYAAKFCFEITETSAISNLQVASDFIRQMRTMGCRFSLDDFGSGLSSFAYLKRLPVDYLKIDGMFVKDIVQDKIDFAMVKSMHEIGEIMGMATIAEFVENDEILRLLQEIGVDYVQGYGIAKPRPIEEILDEHDNKVVKLRP